MMNGRRLSVYQAKIVLILGGLFAFSGCMSTVSEYYYHCDDDLEFSVSFEQQKALITAYDGRKIELTQVRAASDTEYMSDDQMLRLNTVDDDATLIVNGISESICRVTE